MGLRDTVKSIVAIADGIILDLKSDVVLRRNLGDDGSGTITWGPLIPLKASVEWKQKQVRTMAGTLTVSRHSIMFTDTTALLAATNGEGIGDYDRIYLADGTTGPILDMIGYLDRVTKVPYAVEVFLG